MMDDQNTALWLADVLFRSSPGQIALRHAPTGRITTIDWPEKRHMVDVIKEGSTDLYIGVALRRAEDMIGHQGTGGLEQCSYVGALTCDIDEGPPDTLERLVALGASIIVESGGGEHHLHPYWLLQAEEDTPGILPHVADIPEALTRALHRRVRQLLELDEMDKSGLSHARTIRVPGSLNGKTKNMVRVVHYDPTRLYTPASILHLDVGGALGLLPGEATIEDHYQDAREGLRRRAANDVRPQAIVSPIEVEIALTHVDDGDDYDRWLRVGMGLHDWAHGGELGLTLWDDWSRRFASYEPDAVAEKWRSFTERRGYTIRHVMRLARAGGYEDPRTKDLTEAGYAAYIRERYAQDLRYAHGRGWLEWMGGRWRVALEPDTPPVQAMERMRADVIAWHAEACQAYLEAKARGVDKDFLAQLKTHRDRLSKAVHILGSDRVHRATSSILRRTATELHVSLDDIQGDPDVLQVENGAVDLRTGELRDVTREDLDLRRTAIPYDPYIDTTEWDDVVRGVFSAPFSGFREGAYHYFRRCMGYSVTGHTYETAFFVFVGKGASGKTTLLDSILHVLGKLAVPLAEGDILSGKGKDQAHTASSQLLGARLGRYSEVEKKVHLNGAQVKRLTAGEAIQARKMRGNVFNFVNRAKVWIGTNYAPKIDGADDAIRRRVHWHDALNKFTPDSPGFVPDLLERVRSDERWSQMVLRWLVECSMEYYQAGALRPTQESVEAVDRYMMANDPVAQWLEECTVDCPREDSETTKIAYASYKRWADETNTGTLGKINWWSELAAKGYVKAKLRGIWHVAGLRLRDIAEDGQATPATVRRWQ